MKHMTIQMTPKYRFVKLDDLNWCLQELLTRKKDSKDGLRKAGETYWDNLYYYPTLGMACADLARILADEHEHPEEVDTLLAYSDLLNRKCRDLEAIVNDAISAVAATKGGEAV